jgi:hypothetical protein
VLASRLLPVTDRRGAFALCSGCRFRFGLSAAMSRIVAPARTTVGRTPTDGPEAVIPLRAVGNGAPGRSAIIGGERPSRTRRGSPGLVTIFIPVNNSTPSPAAFDRGHVQRHDPHDQRSLPLVRRHLTHVRNSSPRVRPSEPIPASGGIDAVVVDKTLRAATDVEAVPFVLPVPIADIRTSLATRTIPARHAMETTSGCAAVRRRRPRSPASRARSDTCEAHRLESIPMRGYLYFRPVLAHRRQPARCPSPGRGLKK